MPIYKSSQSDVFYKICVLKNFTKLTGKHLYQSFFFNKVASLSLLNLVKFLRTLFFIKHLRLAASEFISEIVISKLKETSSILFKWFNNRD